MSLRITPDNRLHVTTSDGTTHGPFPAYFSALAAVEGTNVAAAVILVPGHGVFFQLPNEGFTFVPDDGELPVSMRLIESAPVAPKAPKRKDETAVENASWRAIEAALLEVYGFRLADIQGPGRRLEHADPRAAVYVLAREAGLPVKAIADRLRVTPRSVVVGVEDAPKRLAANPTWAENVERMRDVMTRPL